MLYICVLFSSFTSFFLRFVLLSFLFLLPFPFNCLLFRPVYIVAYLLRARIMLPEKQPLLASDSKMIFVSRQRLGKHVPAATDAHSTIDVLCFLLGQFKGVIRKTNGVTESVLYGSQWRKGFSWKGAAVQRGHEHRSWRMSTVRSRYQETSSNIKNSSVCV
jgi:hypothetical protein